MPYVHKFVRGEAFESICELVDWIDQGGYCYWNDNVRHAAFMEQQKLAMLRQLVAAHESLCRAEPNPAYTEEVTV